MPHTVLPKIVVDPADVGLPPTQPIDITHLCMAKNGGARSVL
jgi:hypothetical protein